MMYAIITSPLRRGELVRIGEVQKLGEDVARSFEYKCPDENCEAVMRPVFPAYSKENADEAHSSHFRRKINSHHRPDCKKDGIQKKPEGISTPDSKNAPKYKFVKRLPYVVRFSETERVKQKVADVQSPENDETSNLEKQKKARLKTRRSTIHNSEPSTSHIRDIVESFENPVLPLHEMKIKIDRCPAGNYADAFFNVNELETQMPTELPRYVYYGKYIGHNVYPTGTAVLFGLDYYKSKRIGVWIPSELGPRPLSNEIISRFKRAAEDNATIYVLGRFESSRTWKFSIEVKALSTIWITLPNDNERL